VDCEFIRVGFPSQPVNALTALAFVGAGVLLATRRRGTGPVVYGLVLAAVGMTSFLMHGMGLDAAAESVAVVSLALWVALWMALGASRKTVCAWAIATAVGAALIAVAPDVRHTTTAVAAAAAALVLVRFQDRKTWIAFTVVAGAAAVYVLSRTGGPWCVSSSPLQGHGLWHLMMAVALWLVGDALADRPQLRTAGTGFPSRVSSPWSPRGDIGEGARGETKDGGGHPLQ
jgi:hypothetical protein